jgi:dienelactone hydrolase
MHWTIGLFTAGVAFAAGLEMPSLRGPLTIDGTPDETFWQNARILPLGAAGFGAPIPAGGEVRIAIRQGYVCLSARIPEPGRIVAFSTGSNPVFGREDLVTWRFNIRSATTNNRLVALSVNPLGGFRADYTATAKLPDRAKHVLAAAAIGSSEWTVEAAFPVQGLADIGFFTVERVRAPRPDAPELRWHWPAIHERADFRLPPGEFGAMEPPAHGPPAAAPQTSTPASSRAADQLAGEIASIRARTWTAEQRKTVAPERMVHRHLLSRMQAVAAQEKLEWQKVRTLKDWERFRETRLGALRASLAPFPDRTPLRSVITKRRDYGDGFVIENIVFESRPGLLVTANLYLPAKISGQVPAIVVVHSHHAPKTQSELQDMGMTWARSGTAVFVMDQLGAGERVQSNPWPREGYYSRYALGTQLHVAGESLIKWMVWDLMRGIDLLLERPYIDPKRIVMLGAVAGGGDPAAVAAALDKRVAAVIPFNFGEAGPEEHYLEGPRAYDFDTAWPGWGYWETTRNMWRSVADQFFPWFVCASVAPRGFVYAFEIAWPKDVEAQPAWARYKRVFELYGARDRLDQVDGLGPFPGPGECTNVGTFLRKRIYPILNRWFGMAVPAEEYHMPRPDAELMCLTPAVAAGHTFKPASEIAFDAARKQLEEARSKLPQGARDRRDRSRAALKTKLGDIEPALVGEPRPVSSQSGPEFVSESMLLGTDTGISLPVLLLKPAAAQGRLPTVIAFAQQGKERFLSDRSGTLAALIRAGAAICLADVRGTGETAPGASRGPGAMEMGANELMLGNTLLGARLKDARTVYAWISRRPDIDALRIALWGESFAGVNPENIVPYESLNVRLGPRQIQQAEPLGSLLALLTALYEDSVRAVVARRGLGSFLSVLEDRFTYVPLDVIVPGMLQTGDIPDVVRSLAPKPVLLESLVDGRNRRLTPAGWKSVMAPAISGYGDTAGRLLIREESGDDVLAAWLMEQIHR